MCGKVIPLSNLKFFFSVITQSVEAIARYNQTLFACRSDQITVIF